LAVELARACSSRRPPPRSYIVRRIIREVERRALSPRRSVLITVAAKVDLALTAGLSLTESMTDFPTTLKRPTLWQQYPSEKLRCYAAKSEFLPFRLKRHPIFLAISQLSKTLAKRPS